MNFKKMLYVAGVSGMMLALPLSVSAGENAEEVFLQKSLAVDQMRRKQVEEISRIPKEQRNGQIQIIYLTDQPGGKLNP